MTTFSISELRRRIAEQDWLTMQGHWCIRCPRCRRYVDIWPDRDGLLCDECGVALVCETLPAPMDLRK